MRRLLGMMTSKREVEPLNWTLDDSEIRVAMETVGLIRPVDPTLRRQAYDAETLQQVRFYCPQIDGLCKCSVTGRDLGTATETTGFLAGGGYGAWSSAGVDVQNESIECLWATGDLHGPDHSGQQPRVVQTGHQGLYHVADRESSGRREQPRETGGEAEPTEAATVCLLPHILCGRACGTSKQYVAFSRRNGVTIQCRSLLRNDGECQEARKHREAAGLGLWECTVEYVDQSEGRLRFCATFHAVEERPAVAGRAEVPEHGVELAYRW